MIPGRGFARVRPGLVFRNPLSSSTPARSTPRLTGRVASPRQFGTGLRASGRPFHGACPTGLSFRGRIGAAAVLSSQSIPLSSAPQARFASTGHGPSPAEAAASSPSSFSDPYSPPSEFPSDFSLSDLDGASLLNTPETIGYLHNLGLDYGWGPTALSQWFVEHLHIWGGLPWWASIVGFAVIVRLVMVRPALIAQQESVKMMKMRKDPLFNSLNEKWSSAMMGAVKLPRAELAQLRLQMNIIRERHGVKMWKTFLPMLQAPLAFAMFRLTNGMSSLPVPGFDTAGVLWFTDLTVADPYLILPFVSSAMMYFSIKRGVPYMSPQQASYMVVVPFILGPLSFFITFKMAAAVQLYFAATALLQYLQTTFFHIGWIRQVCGLPPIEEMVHNADAAAVATARARYHARYRRSPFSGQGAPQYQAPRTINTTATENKPASDSPIGAFKEAWAAIKDKSKKRGETIAEKNTRKEAEQYEKRRRQEEYEEFLRRREAKRRNEGK